MPVAVATWGPLVFVHPDAAAPPLETLLGSVPASVRAGGLDPEGLRFHSRVEYELQANWKVVIENYLECYHCAVAHPGFSSVVEVDPTRYRLEASSWSSSQFCGLRETPRGPGTGTSYQPSGEITEGQFHFLWPNTRLNVFPGRPNLSVGTAIPIGPERTRGFFDYFFGEGVTEGETRDLLAFDDQVGREDRVLVESVQRGVRSGVLGSGRLLPQSEQLIAHFQQLVRRALAD